MPRLSNQAISSGTSVAARSLRGFAIKPTALSLGLGIEKKLAITFGSLDRALDEGGTEPIGFDACLHAIARLTMLGRIPHNSSFADFAFSGFELRLQQDDHFTTFR